MALSKAAKRSISWAIWLLWVLAMPLITYYLLSSAWALWGRPLLAAWRLNGPAGVLRVTMESLTTLGSLAAGAVQLAFMYQTLFVAQFWLAMFVTIVAGAQALGGRLAAMIRNTTLRRRRGKGGSCTSGASASSLSHEQLQTLTPVLLPHLTPAERMALARTSRALAAAVWRASPSIRLSLQGSGASLLSRRRPLAGRIASSWPRFHPTQAFLTRITALSLADVRTSAAELRSALALLPALHHLHLLRCTVTDATAVAPPPAGAVPAPPPGLPLRALHCLEAEPSLLAPLSLLDPSTLESIATDDSKIFSVLRASSPPTTPLYPALRVLKLTDSSSATLRIHDADLDLLLTRLPTMHEVCIPEPVLSRDHAHQNCHWGLLRLQHGAKSPKFMTLACLPLACMGRIVVELEAAVFSHSAPLAMSEVLSRLQDAEDRIEFVPCITGWGHLWAWSQKDACQVDLGLDDQEPGFTVHFALVPAAAPEAEQLLAFAAAHMTTVGGGLGTFVLSDLNRDLGNPAAALAPLRSLAPGVRSVCLRNCAHVPRDPRTLFAFLPDHVERLVIKRPNSAGPYLHAKLIRKVYARDRAAAPVSALTAAAATEDAGVQEQAAGVARAARG